jgi:hypothetical protein
VQSGASVARNVETLFFMLGCDRYEFHKNCAGTRYVDLLFLHLVGSARHIVHFGASGVRHDLLLSNIFHARVGPVRISQKFCWYTLY